MRKRIEYRNEDQVAAMRAFMIDAMVEEDFRNDDEDFILDFFGEQITKEELTIINSEISNGTFKHSDDCKHIYAYRN